MKAWWPSLCKLVHALEHAGDQLHAACRTVALNSLCCAASGIFISFHFCVLSTFHVLGRVGVASMCSSKQLARKVGPEPGQCVQRNFVLGGRKRRCQSPRFFSNAYYFSKILNMLSACQKLNSVPKKKTLNIVQPRIFQTYLTKNSPSPLSLIPEDLVVHQVTTRGGFLVEYSGM